MSDLLENKIKELADQIRKQAVDALSEFECDILPYVEEDTISNARFQAEDIVEDIITGNFEWDGDYIVVAPARTFSPRVRLEMTSHKWDMFRDNIIKWLPKCPKDAKIEALKEELKQAYRRW